MKKIALISFLSLLFACSTTTVTETPKVVPDAKEAVEAPEPELEPIPKEETKFEATGYSLMEWGSPMSLVNNPENLATFAKMGTQTIVTDKIFLVNTYGSEMPGAKRFMMLWGYDNQKLVFGSMLWFADDPQKVPDVCQQVAGFNVAEYGPPTAVFDESTLIWQNEDTTLVMVCSNYGPLMDWYSTMWLRYNPSFVAHRAIPQEALDGNFGEKVP